MIQDVSVRVAEETLSQSGIGVGSTVPNENDVVKFQEVMGRLEVGQTTSVPVTGTVERAGQVEHNLGIGDQILNSMQKFGDHRKVQETKINEIVHTDINDAMGVQDMLKLQLALMNMGHERDIITKVVDKTSQGVQTLLRNQ